MTAYGTIDVAMEAGRRGIDAFLEKPFFEEEFEQAIRLVLRADGHATTSGHTSRSIRSSTASSWARLVAAIVRNPDDAHSVVDWSRIAAVPKGTIERRCAAVGLAPKVSLDFARLLRAVHQSRRLSCDPEILLDADPRTLRRLGTFGLDDSAARRSLSAFLCGQNLVTDPLLRREILEILRESDPTSPVDKPAL
jgi:hypothetical protein